THAEGGPDVISIALFFFQAEDGIRDGHVTGVQTCALPISCAKATNKRSEAGRRSRQLPARLITRIAARTGGDARARSASRTAVSPGREGMKPTASASTRKQPALAIRTLRRRRRGGKPGSTATAAADEPQTAPAGPADGVVRVGRDQEERAPAEPVKDADGRVECPDLRDLGWPDGEEVTDEHRAHLLGAVRRAVREEHGSRGRDGIHDADHRLLGHVTPSTARQREHERPEERGGEAERVRLPR